MLFFKKNRRDEEVKHRIPNEVTIIPFVWEILTKEQKIKIANIVLKGETSSIPCGGQFEYEEIKECYDIEERETGVWYKFKTGWVDVSFKEQQIIDRWLWYTKHGNKDYNKLKR